MIQWHGWSNKSNYWWWWSVHRFLLTIIWDWSLYKRWLLKICIKWPISWHIFPVSVAWMLVHHRFTPNIKFTVTYSIYSWVESHCERNASSQKHYTVSPAAAKTQTARIRVKHTNPEAIAFPCCLTGGNLIRGLTVHLTIRDHFLITGASSKSCIATNPMRIWIT